MITWPPTSDEVVQLPLEIDKNNFSDINIDTGHRGTGGGDEFMRETSA